MERLLLSFFVRPSGHISDLSRPVSAGTLSANLEWCSWLMIIVVIEQGSLPQNDQSNPGGPKVR